RMASRTFCRCRAWSWYPLRCSDQSSLDRMKAGPSVISRTTARLLSTAVLTSIFRGGEIMCAAASGRGEGQHQGKGKKQDLHAADDQSRGAQPFLAVFVSQRHDARDDGDHGDEQGQGEKKHGGVHGGKQLFAEFFL